MLAQSIPAINRPRSRQWVAALLVALLPLLLRANEELQTGDTLDISVYNHAELGITARIAESGAIRVPLVGRVQAAGQSSDALAESLGKSWQKAGIADAFVTIRVAEYAPRIAYVLGQVGGGGQRFDILPGASLTAMQTIISSGGFSPSADLRKVAVLRMVEGRTKRIPVDAIGFINAVPGTSDVSLSPGDIVVVPRALPITVLGMVGKPGTIEVDTARTTLASQVIGLAGGFQKGAVRDRVLILRQTEKGAPQRIMVNVGSALAGNIEDDTPVIPGDTVIVREAERIYICGQVSSPGALDLDPEVPLTLMRAITLCGGFTEFANQRKVALVRNQKSTDVDLRNVLIENDKIANDMALQPGDMVFVRESIW
jgi:protein involved in polysaccharide export with SLBB domain